MEKWFRKGNKVSQAVAMQDQEGMRDRMPPRRGAPPWPPPSLSAVSAALTMARHLSNVSSMPHAAWMALSFCHATASPYR